MRPEAIARITSARVDRGFTRSQRPTLNSPPWG